MEPGTSETKSKILTVTWSMIVIRKTEVRRIGSKMNTPHHSPIIAVVASVLTLLSMTGVQAADAISQAPDQTVGTRPLTTDELYAIYANRTWMWEDGAGYFQVAGRRFTAFSKSGPNGSYAEGRWFLTNPGRTCFSATWFAADGNAKAVTCFDHRTDGRTISQRRLPDGEWYVFSHLPSQRGDEILKLKAGNRVAAGYERNKMALSR